MKLYLAGVATGAVLALLCAVIADAYRFWRDRRRSLARLRGL